MYIPIWTNMLPHSQAKMKSNKAWNNNTQPLSCYWQITLSKNWEKFANGQSQSGAPQFQCTYQIWWKSIEISSSYRPESKIRMYCRQITLPKMDEIRPLAIPKQMSTISMHTPSLVKIHWFLLKLSSRYVKTDVLRQIAQSKVDEICPSAIPKQTSTISMHTASLLKNHWHLLIIRKWKYYRGQITLSKIDEICPLTIPSSQYQCTHRVWWKYIAI